MQSDFEWSIRQKKVELKVDPLPELEAVPVQMNQLFHNLLSNALKFVEPGATPVIHIGCRKIGQDEMALHDDLQKDIPHYEISFRDNGIGFEPAYAERIFLIFQRLHGQASYPGSGIGLALCRKIVMNHRGKIYATSTPGAGSCFYIILPEKGPS